MYMMTCRCVWICRIRLCVPLDGTPDLSVGLMLQAYNTILVNNSLCDPAANIWSHTIALNQTTLKSLIGMLYSAQQKCFGKSAKLNNI